MARLTDYSEEIAVRICSELADGKCLKEICLAEDMPDKSTVYRWIAAHDKFRDLYAHAREDQADTLADEIIHISDNTQIGIKTRTGKDGLEITEGDMIEHRRLQVDARKWVAAKLKPKKYGDKLTNEHTGANGGPVIVEHTFKSGI